jgi:hypothetical protein
MSEPVVWRRLNVSSPYVGDADVSGTALRLSGREPVSGIEVSLAIPFTEIERVRTSRTAAEELGGEPSVVLELTESDSVCLRSAGTRSTLPVRLARTLGKAMSTHTRPVGLAGPGR